MVYRIHSRPWKQKRHTVHAALLWELQVGLPVERRPSQTSLQKKVRSRSMQTKSDINSSRQTALLLANSRTRLDRTFLDESGDVSRKKLGAIVFNDKAAREQLNSILHPLIIERSRGHARQLVTEDPTCIVLLDAPLLIEAGAYDTVDLIVVVTASSETQLRRTLERSVAQGRPLTKTEVQARIDAQMPVTEKVKYADVVIENEGTLEELHRQVDALWEKLQK